MTSRSDPNFATRLLKSPARRRVLGYLLEHGPARFVDIKKGTELPTGVIYHHLRSMGGLVEQDSNKMYSLSSEGRSIAQSLINAAKTGNTDAYPVELAEMNDLLLEQSPKVAKLVSLFTMTPIYKALSLSRALQVAVFVASLEFAYLVASARTSQFAAQIWMPGSALAGLALTLFSLYMLTLIFVWFVHGREPAFAQLAAGGNRGWSNSVKQFAELDLLSALSVGLAIVYLAGYISTFGTGASDALASAILVWGLVCMAAALSFTRGMEFMPALIFPFAVAIFFGAADSYLSGGFAIDRTVILLVLGLASMFISKLIDNEMERGISSSK